MNIVFLDITQNYGYHFSAANTKVELLSKGLTLCGDSCTIHNGILGYSGVEGRTVLNVKGVGNVITCPRHRLAEAFGFWPNLRLLWIDLKRLRENNGCNVLVLSEVFYHLYCLYVIVGRLLGYKIVTISHEWSTTIHNRYWIKNVSSSIYTKLFGYGIHAILPISRYIWRRAKHFGKPMLMTPILAEYRENPSLFAKEDHFVYCVHAGYSRVITLLLTGYDEYIGLTEAPIRLTLVLAGPQFCIDNITNYVQGLPCRQYIDIKHQLPYEELYHNYQTARALFIPLDPANEQDHARFSQKIAEYLSSASPIITNSVGEIPYYFTSKKDIILCDYDPHSFANTLLWVQNHQEEAEKIGLAGFELGRKEFNYATFGKRLHQFFQTL